MSGAADGKVLRVVVTGYWSGGNSIYFMSMYSVDSGGVGYISTPITLAANKKYYFEFTYLSSSWILTNHRGPLDMKGVRRYPVEPPFWPTLGQYESGYYFFTLTDGCINKRIPGAIAYATGKACKAIPPNTELEDEIEERKRFDITVGQQISVIVKVLDTGRVSEAEDAVTVVAEDERDEHDADGGVHYIPVAGGTYGVAGEYHYKLALLKPPVYGVKPAWLKMVLAGSHLSHWQDLPRFATPGGVAMSYDAADNKYSVRGNSVNGSITFKDCSNNVIKTVAWADGLITTAENITLIVPPCGGSSSS